MAVLQELIKEELTMLGKNTEAFRQLYVQKSQANPITNKENKSEQPNIATMRTSTDAYFKELLGEIKMPEGVNVTEQSVSIDKHPVKFRIYQAENQTKPAPVIIFHPGGGLALDMQTLHDFPCMSMCKAANAMIISIQPPLAPEIRHPHIFDVAYKATKYIYQHAKEFDIDPKQFVVSGYSMGGNLAALIVNKARKDKNFTITGQVLISAQTDLSLSIRRDPQFNSGADLDFMAPISMQELFINFSKPDGMVDLKDPSFSPYFDDLKGLPPTVLISGGCDSLMPDMRAMAKKLSAAGVKVEEIIIPGQIHNTMLLYPLLGDGLNPASVAGEAATNIFFAILK